MKQKNKIFSCLLLCFAWPLAINALTAISAIGGNATLLPQR